MSLVTITGAFRPSNQEGGFLGPYLAPKLLGTYFADASDAGPVDTGPNWDNDDNAFDGTISTVASVTAAGSDADLSGDGTTAPTTGDPISEVWFRHRYNPDTQSLRWSPWFKLEDTGPPWTWTVVSELSVEWIYNNGLNFFDVNVRVDAPTGQIIGAERVTGIFSFLDVAKVEFRVFGPAKTSM